MTTPPGPLVHVGADTNLRHGVCHVNPVDNLITTLAEGDYPALGQCRGATVTEGTAFNDWWVRISADGQTGWVTAVAITVPVGGNGEQIPGITTVATVNT